MLPCSSSEQWLTLGWSCHYEKFGCQKNWGAYQEHSQISKDKAQAEHHQQVPPFLPSSCSLPEESAHWRSSLRCLNQAKKNKTVWTTEVLCPGPTSTTTNISPTLLIYLAVKLSKTRPGLLHPLVRLSMICAEASKFSGCLRVIIWYRLTF